MTTLTPYAAVLNAARWGLMLALIMACPSAVAAWDNSARSGFRVHTIDAQATYSACAVFDVDRDGDLDIFSGGWWYEAPTWARHFVRDVEQIRGRYDDYSNLPLDVNGDGWLDLVSANYRSQTLYWVQHPGNQDEAWQRHVIDRPGAMETGRLFDVNGDGRLDVLPNGVQFAAWWECVPPQQPQAAADWIRHDLPSEIAAHGIGGGDIDGDGRPDIVSPRGWWQQTADGRWHRHDEFQLHADAGLPILVVDIDHDHDLDIVWGRGHNIGLYYLEQQRDGDRRSWQFHVIDSSISQAHSLLWADMDLDQQPDLVAGKRYMGHDGKDPGEYDPLAVYWYKFDPQLRSWQRRTVCYGGPVGFGLDPKAADVDGDGDTDLVAAGRSGLYWIENRFGAESQSEGETTMAAASYPDHSELLVFHDQKGQRKPVTNPAEWARRRDDILQGMQQAMGPLPETQRRVPLEMEVVQEIETPSYWRRTIWYTPEPGDRVPALLLIPKQLQGKTPAILCLHQTTPLGKKEPAGMDGRPSRFFAHELAERGYICLVPDYPSFGDYPFDFQAQGKPYSSGSMKAIWNNLRAVDLLESLPEVDRDRIGCIGHSLGGHNALFTAVFDQRLRAVATSCGFTAFHHYYDGNLRGWTSDRYMPRIRDVYENDPDRVPFDFYEVLAAIAPRPIFVNAPLHDANFDVRGVRKVQARVDPIYELLGAPRGLTIVYPDAEHDFPDSVRQQTYEWFDRVLQK